MVHTNSVLITEVLLLQVCTTVAVKSPNEGHFGTVKLSFVRRLSFMEKSRMYWKNREKIF